MQTVTVRNSYKFAKKEYSEGDWNKDEYDTAVMLDLIGVKFPLHMMQLLPHMVQHLFREEIVPKSLLRKQAKYLDNHKNILMVWIIYRYIQGSTAMLKSQRELEILDEDFLDGFDGKTEDLIDPFLHYLNPNINKDAHYGFTFGPESPNYDEILEKIYDVHPIEMAGRLSYFILAAPRSPRSFKVVRYSYEGNYKNLPYTTSLSLNIGQKLVTNSISSVSYFWEDSIMSTLLDRFVKCSTSCCIQSIEVPPNFPCMFINHEENEMLLPPGVEMQVVGFRITPLVWKSDYHYIYDIESLYMREKTTDIRFGDPTKDRESWLKNICNNGVYIIIIDLKIIGFKQEV